MRPEVIVEFDGQDGNIFFIVGKAIATLKNYGMHKQADELLGFYKVVGSYDDALRYISKYVKIIPFTNSAEIHALLRDIEKNMK